MIRRSLSEADVVRSGSRCLNTILVRHKHKHKPQAGSCMSLGPK